MNKVEIKIYLLAMMVSVNNELDKNDLASHITLAYWTQEKQREAELLEELQNKCLWFCNTDAIEVGEESFFDTPKCEKKVLLLKKSKSMQVLQEKVFEVVNSFSLVKDELQWFGENWNPHISFYPDGMQHNAWTFVKNIKLLEKHPVTGNWMEVKTF